MEYRQLGHSGLQVPVLSFGTATFGGGNEFFQAWGNTQVDEATRLVQVCLDAGINLFDTSNVYSHGASEEILGKALSGLRNRVLISTKATFKMSDAPNDYGSSRYHLIKSCEDSLRRLQTDHIDVYHMHGFDGVTPVEETLRTLDDLVQSGKVRYIAASNFSGWNLMKSLAVSDKYGWNRYVAHQVYYSLLNRDLEWELMPLGTDQRVGSFVWSPLAGGLLGGKYRRNQPVPADSRAATGLNAVPPEQVSNERLYRIMDSLDEIAAETGKSVSQIAFRWVLQRPTVSSIIIGARNEKQLKENLEVVHWSLTTDQLKKLDSASNVPPAYPYWHQRQNTVLNPLPDFYGER